MSYKFEVLAGDLIEERDRLLRQVERLKSALKDIEDGWGDGRPFSGTACAAIANAALTKE